MLIGWIPCAVIVGFLAVTTGFMPGGQPQVVATNSPIGLDEMAARLKAHVSALATDIGERSAFSTPEMLSRSADYVRNEFRKLEYEVISNAFEAGGIDVENLATVIPGSKRPHEIVVVGAHYDSALGTPAANDNGSGIAALLELARALRGRNLDRALHLVAFTTEEPPFFQTGEMGSMQYAKHLRGTNDHVVAMLSLETLGYYSDVPGSQRYPPGLDAFYPHTGNFVAFVGNVGSFGLMRQCLKQFQQASTFPSQGAALPGFLPGVGWSDHWSFWQHDYDAIMVTDTAPFRYFDYHEASDTPEKIDYERMAQVVSGLESVVIDLATVAES
ncbi:MAG: M28 family peptidase [Chrysiogenetes bacterium]|nr:M28 family peptidase [Chrysiogenetes bacterium]